MQRFRSVLRFGACLMSLGLSFAAEAADIGCNGRNLLDDIKASDPAAFTRIRQAADSVKNGRTVLWKIQNEEKPDHAPSYLFGALQVSDERLKKLSPAVMEALSLSRHIAMGVEAMGPDRVQEALGVMPETLLPEPQRLDALLAKPQAERLNALLAKTDLPKEWVSRLRPWVAVYLTSASDCEIKRLKEGKRTMDVEISYDAENRGIGTFGLETPEMKLSAFASVPDQSQVSLLKADLAARERLDDATEMLIALYLAHDIGALWPAQMEFGKRAGADPEALEAYHRAVVDERNRSMRNRALMHLIEGGVFIAVNAEHLPGDDGLVELFRDAGYTLTPIE